MTPTEFKECLHLIGMDQGEFADHIGIRRETVNRYATGSTNIPKLAALYLRRLADDARRPATIETFETTGTVDLDEALRKIYAGDRQEDLTPGDPDAAAVERARLRDQRLEAVQHVLARRAQSQR
jgi:hypothetical protein